MTDLHLRLLASPKFPYYSAAYYKALPFIVELRSKGADKDVPELETCFDAMYGVLMLKLQEKGNYRRHTESIESNRRFTGYACRILYKG